MMLRTADEKVKYNMPVEKQNILFNNLYFSPTATNLLLIFSLGSDDKLISDK